MSKSPSLPQTSLDSFASHPSLDKHRQEMNVVLQWFIPYWKHFLSKRSIQSSFAFTCLLFSLALAHKYLLFWRFLCNIPVPIYPVFSPWIVRSMILKSFLCFAALFFLLKMKEPKILDTFSFNLFIPCHFFPPLNLAFLLSGPPEAGSKTMQLVSHCHLE